MKLKHPPPVVAIVFVFQGHSACSSEFTMLTHYQSLSSLTSLLTHKNQSASQLDVTSNKLFLSVPDRKKNSSAYCFYFILQTLYTSLCYAKIFQMHGQMHGETFIHLKKCYESQHIF